MIQLNRCRLCKGKAIVLRGLKFDDVYRSADGPLKADVKYKAYRVRCTNCFAKTEDFDTVEQAVKAWNGEEE